MLGLNIEKKVERENVIFNLSEMLRQAKRDIV